MFFEKKCITFFLQNFTIQIYYTNIKKKINIKVYRKLQILLYKCEEWILQKCHFWNNYTRKSTRYLKKRFFIGKEVRDLEI